MNAIKDLFLNATPREQILMSVGGGILCLVFIYWISLKPLNTKLEKQTRLNTQALQEQQQVRELAAALLSQAQQPTQATINGGLIDVLNSTLPKYQLQMEDFQPSGNSDARVRLAKADFNKIMTWLNELENVQSVQIKELNTAPGPEVGTALVSLRLHRE